MHKNKGQKVVGGLTFFVLDFLTIASIITRDADLVLNRSSHERVKAESDAGSVTPFEWQSGARVFMEPDFEFLTLAEEGNMLATDVIGGGHVTHAEATMRAANISESSLGFKTTTSRLMSLRECQDNEDILAKVSDGEEIWWTTETDVDKAAIVTGADIAHYTRNETISEATGPGTCTSKPYTEPYDKVTTVDIDGTSTHEVEPAVWEYDKLEYEDKNDSNIICMNPDQFVWQMENYCKEHCTNGVDTSVVPRQCLGSETTQAAKVGDTFYTYYTYYDRPYWCNGTSVYVLRNHRVITVAENPHKKIDASCPYHIDSAQAAIRPRISIDPGLIFFATKSDEASRDPRSELNKFGETNTRALSTGETAGYKFTLRDDAMSLSDVKVKKEDPSVQQTGNKIYIQKGTSTLILDASTGGTGDSAPNGIAALSYDSAGNEVIGTLASITSAGTTQISIDLSNLMDVNTLGSSKKISLYAEQQNGVKTTDYMSAPYDIEVVVSEEQKLSLDTDSQTKDTVMYGETLELTALVNEGDTTIGWAEDTPLTVSIPEVDKSKVEIKSQTWDVKTGQLLVQLNPLVGGDACFQLELNKEASVSDETYLKADSVKTQPIKLKNRPITVTPKGYLLFDGTPFNSDFPWEFETKLSDESMSGNALMNGDTLPYAVEMAALTADTSASPQVDKDGLLTVENGGKEWGLSLKEEDASAIEIFEKKYTVTKNNYHKIDNPTSKLRVDTFKGIKIISNPDDAIANKDDTYRFVIEAKYDVNIPNLEGTTDIEYQGFTYQWEISTDGGAGWHEAPGNGTVSYDDVEGIATITYTGTNAQTDDAGTLFRCKVWNKRDLVNNKKPISKEAELSVRTDPAVFIEIPKTIEMEKKNALLIGTKEMQKIKLVEFDNKISDNKPGKQTTPEGAFQIDTDPTFQLTLIQGVEETRKAIYDVTVYKEDNRTAVTEDRELMILDYKDKKEGGFCVKTKVDNDKPTGTYKGKMVFTITYTPKSISE